MSRRLVLAIGCAAVAAVVAPVLLSTAPLLVWNATASTPIGLYSVRPGAHADVGDHVLIRAPDQIGAWLAERRYVPLGVPLIKRVAAVAPSRVCRDGSRVWVEGGPTVAVRDRDRVGRPLPAWSGCRRLGSDEIFLLNTEAPDSLDSRYFGPLSRRAVIGRVAPLWTRQAR